MTHDPGFGGSFIYTRLKGWGCVRLCKKNLEPFNQLIHAGPKCLSWFRTQCDSSTENSLLESSEYQSKQPR